MELDEYLPVLQQANARFADVTAAAALQKGWQAHVPGCPGWTLAWILAPHSPVMFACILPRMLACQ